MRKTIFKAAVAGALVCISYGALADITIKGRLLNEANKAIKSARVSLGNVSAKTDRRGYYQLTVDDADVYQLNFAKDGYYQSIQTFSHFELTEQARNASDSVSIDDITLVEKAKGRVMFAFTGDAMMGRRYYKPAFGDAVLINEQTRLADSKAIVENVKPYLSLADIATTNLETQVFDQVPGDAAPKSIAFFSKPEILDAVKWAGIDYVTLGNNHTYDYKDSGLADTLKHLRKSGLGFSGADHNEEKALKAYQTTLNGVDYGMLGYVGWEGRAKPNQVAEQDKGGAAFGNLKNIIQSVGEQVDAGRVPVVQYHGGYEYSNNPSGLTEQRLKTAIDTGAAVAIAHHPHVTQGIELYNGQLIAYSMGNFVFDQYIPSTPYSFILYVWLDGGNFHRAEIVPVYLKGYKPTPATGLERHTTMQRISALSAQRNTIIGRSGGHGVIEAKQGEQKSMKASVNFANNSKVAPLYLLPFHQEISEVNAPKGINYRLGTNLMNGSDFESFNFFNSPERSWFFDRANTVVNSYGASGSKSLGLKVAANQASEVGLQPFRRLFKGDRPTTILAKLKTDNAAKVSFYWQGRRFSQKFYQARKESDWNLIESVDLAGSNDWQALEVDFNSVRYNYPSKGFRAYRVKAVIELENGATGQVDIDDFAVVEWQSSFSNKAKPLHTSVESPQASFIGINKPTTKPLVLTIK
ncbi:CapA family protein [Endozoicomonas sp. G2_1]|uniref:CapA family protein n=1 Tax=Endozoicomonas sp. G2_1 TaxID=2821091 RepID=UPI001ADD4491|nr:CapA family protein [Endozoicomonas sp. G2_1]MBO9490425.1 CapA family protein [Endozoicomonas sp. G2_1]